MPPVGVIAAARAVAANPKLQYVANPLYTPLKPNSDPHYKFSLDFSTLCKKRLVLQSTLEALQNNLGRGLFADEFIAVRKRLKDEGHVVSCGVCYVDTRRMNLRGSQQQFLSGPGSLPQ